MTITPFCVLVVLASAIQAESLLDNATPEQDPNLHIFAVTANP